jgi:uncharacterized protein
VLDAILNVISALSMTDVVWIMAGALAGGLVNGLTGFGTGVSALPFWVNAVEPVLASQMAAGAAVASQLSTLKSIWHAIRWRDLAPLIGAGVVGIPLGLWLQPHIDAVTFKIAVGAITCVYALVMLTAGGRFSVRIDHKGVEALVGFFSGVMGGIAGISGVLPTMWAALNDWPKERRRSVFQAFNLTVLATVLAANIVTGRLGASFIGLLLIALPCSLFGAWSGNLIYRRVDNRRFDRVVLALLLMSGLGMVADWRSVDWSGWTSYFGDFIR